MKYVVRIEKDRIKLFRIKKGPRQMVSIASRLYVTTDDLAVKDLHTDDAMYFYPIDATQPLLHKAQLVDPDRTRALIRSAQLGGNKKKMWANIDPGLLGKYLVPIVVIVALIYGFFLSG